MTFRTVIEKYRKSQFSKRDLGDHFERLMQAFLRTYQVYDGKFENVWLWNEFPYRYEFGNGQDVGIDIVCKTVENEYWAVQCKCYDEKKPIEKSDVDTFLSTSGKKFKDEACFSHRLWISTTNNWSSNAEEALRSQVLEVQRLNLSDLENAQVDWDKLDEGIFGVSARWERFKVRPYQEEALKAVHNYLLTHDRGKLIMACGTGKTFLALKIAEYETGNKGLILVLTPSISLISQTLRTWCEQCDVSIHSVCICSDASVSRKKTDSSDVSTIDLALPASTDRENIHRQILRALQYSKGMTVVFSTYQSIDVISSVQKRDNFEFDLIICDEAHRTTGVTLAGEDESSFVKVHDNAFLKAKKRLYMTATPRIYRDVDKKKAELRDAVVCSMDDKKLYGDVMYHLSFGIAVDKGLLSDYKVLVLTVNDSVLTPSVYELVHSPKSLLTADDATKLVGCYNALSKQIVGDDGVLITSDPNHMRRAVAFCQNISVSKRLTEEFNSVQDKYLADLPEDRRSKLSRVNAEHVDGTMRSTERDSLLNWLKNDDIGNDSECRILTNVRCLSEGVDVPSLDAVLFLSPKNSKIDIVQSVGRVMRRSPGKKYGYIVIPLVIPSDVDPTKELDSNSGNYKVVWDVLNALRSHDERLAIEVERIKLDKKKSSRVLIGGVDSCPNFVQTNLLSHNIFPDLQGAIYARMVNKVGQRQYWEHWANKVIDIASKHKSRIQSLVGKDNVAKIFFEFVESLREIINPGVSDAQAIEMLSQHLITKPVFEALFEDYSFSANNPVSISMQKMIRILEENAFEKETQELDKFYESVQNTIRDITTTEGRQAVLAGLYENFFSIAFPKMVEQLGIVYTPIEIVDFILHSVNDILKKEFGKLLSDPGVNILDPFTGTGTFVTRLLQNKSLIEHEEDLKRKYLSEIYANEIVLLPYYIASVNIENAYHSRLSQTGYKAFPGGCLTDTFQMEERRKKEHLDTGFFVTNSEKVEEQEAKNITVIVGNPPYSIGQKSANDNAQNRKYQKLEKKIKDTYAMDSKATDRRAAYDSYIKAFRWATDRLGKNGGVIGFVTNGGWIDGNAMDGFRKHLAKDFSSIYVFNLRGNCRTSGELRKKEGQEVFPGIRVSPTIVLLVKNPNSTNDTANIYYHDVGDYLSRKEKFEKIKSFGSVCSPEMRWSIIHPNEDGDWINQRNPIFSTYYSLGDKKGNESEEAVFGSRYSYGLVTARDAWCYNSSRVKLCNNIQRSIEFYNSQVDAFKKEKIKNSKPEAKDFVTYDSAKFSWSRGTIAAISKQKKYYFCEESVRSAMYRPFFKQFVYFNRDIVEMVQRIPRIFPILKTRNLVICISGIGVTKEFSALIVDVVPDAQLMANAQCFPLYYYEITGKGDVSTSLSASQTTLFRKDEVRSENRQYVRKDGVSDFILNEARSKYSDNVTKEDIFYYVYGFLHSKEYKETFSSDLKKMLARIPLIDGEKDFWSFSHSGGELADLHLHYEDVDPYPDVKVTGIESQNFRVEKMRFVKDKSTIQYNASITISNIPTKAYDYVVNGKSAIEWIMERYSVTVDKDTCITNDPNEWSEEHGNSRYILDLLLSVINVSMKTMEIVEKLPRFV